MAAIAHGSISLSSPSYSQRKTVTQAVRSPPTSFAVSGGRRSAALPQFASLKIQSCPGQSSASLSSRNSRVFRRSANISCQAQGIAVDVPIVTDAMWKSQVLNTDGPVLVEFYASWCGPCRIIHPVIGELANEYAGKLKCFKLNTDDSPSIATQYGIRSVPTTLLLVNGEKKDLVLGAVPKSTLVSSIEKIL